MAHHNKTEKHIKNMKLLNQSENQQKTDIVEKNKKPKVPNKELQDIMKKILETVIAYEDDGKCLHII